jgi:tetratricopeptide (TPR) repeat protein
MRIELVLVHSLPDRQERPGDGVSREVAVRGSLASARLASISEPAQNPPSSHRGVRWSERYKERDKIDLFSAKICRYHADRFTSFLGCVVGFNWSSLLQDILHDAKQNAWHRLLIAAAVALTVVVVLAVVRRLWRTWSAHWLPRQKAARALIEQGEYHAHLKHRSEAMELYNLAVELHPRNGHVYYLRGCLYAEFGDPRRAIADWKRCLARLPRHADARRRLMDIEQHTRSSWQQPTSLLGVTVVLVVVLLVAIALL